jgi:putrescine transport system ATP-binding protein
MILSTRIVVMNQGRFEQVGTPGEVYEYPGNRFVADFIGKVNLMQAVVKTVEGELVTLECEEAGADLFTVADAQNIPQTGLKKWIAVRPEKIFISKQHPVGDGLTVLKGTVEDLGYFGNLSLYKVALANGKILQVSGQNRIRTATKTVEWDDEVFISWDNHSAVLLEA